MQKARTKLGSQGQVSVPAEVRNFLHLMPGSVLVWSQKGDRIVVERSRRHTPLGFSDCLVLEIARKAGHLPLATFDKALGRLAGAQKP